MGPPGEPARACSATEHAVAAYWPDEGHILLVAMGLRYEALTPTSTECLVPFASGSLRGATASHMHKVGPTRGILNYLPTFSVVFIMAGIGIKNRNTGN